MAKVVHSLGLLCTLLVVLVHNNKGAHAYEFIVGGQKGWSVPSDPNFNPLNQWAQKSRFQVGDSLVFNYQSGQDSVLYVKSEDYGSCNTGSPYAKFSDGHTVFKLNQSGPHFFISGNKDNCNNNLKLQVVVLAHRTTNNSSSSNNNTNASPPSPSAPSPSPPAETNPTPAPVTEPPPPNAAASVFVNFAGSVGAFMASTFLILSL